MNDVLDHKILDMKLSTISDKLLQYLCENDESEVGVECKGVDEKGKPFVLVVHLKEVKE